MPAYEADLERFKGYDAQVLGISVDSVPCNTAWAKSTVPIVQMMGSASALSSSWTRRGNSRTRIFTIFRISRITKIYLRFCGNCSLLRNGRVRAGQPD